MAFSDNPLIGALMNATGLDGMMGAAGNGAPLGAGAAASSAPHSPQNIPPYRNRPYIPRPETPQGGSMPQQNAPVPQGQMSLDTLQSPTVHDLLAHYGVSAPDNIDQHLFIHNPDAFAKHPLISGLIENGLSGLANYHTGATTADTISNIAQSVLGNQAMHTQYINNQLMSPINQANAVGSLMENKQRQDLQEANAKRADAQTDWYNNQFDLKQQTLDMQQQLGQQRLAAQTQHETDTTDPMRALLTQTINQMKSDRAKPYNGDQTKLTSDDLNSILHSLSQQQSQDKSAGQVNVQNVRNAGRVAKGGNAKVDPQDTATLQAAQKAARQAQIDMKNVTNNGIYVMIPGADGKPKVALKGTQEYSAAIAQHQAIIQHANDLNSQFQRKYGAGLSGNTTQPQAQIPSATPANGNPFR